MSIMPALLDLQTLASTMEANLDALAPGLRTPAAQRHLVRGAGMLHALIRELGAAVVHEHLHEQLAALRPAATGGLTAEVVGPRDPATPGQPR